MTDSTLRQIRRQIRQAIDSAEWTLVHLRAALEASRASDTRMILRAQIERAAALSRDVQALADAMRPITPHAGD